MTQFLRDSSREIAALPVRSRFRVGVAAAGLLVLLGVSGPASGQTGCVYDWVAGNPWPSLDDDGPAGLVTWDPDGPGPANQQVVIWGDFTVAGNVKNSGTGNNATNGIAIWDGVAFRTMADGPADAGQSHSGLGTYDADGDGPLPERLYCVRGNGALQVWDGLQLNTVASVNPLGVGANYRGIANILQFDPDGDGPRDPLMIIGGAGGVGSQGNSRDTMAAYDGSSVFALTPGAGFNGIVFGMTLHDPDGAGGPAKADLIAWGQFTQHNGTPMLQIARFDGTDWFPVGAGFGSGAAPGQVDETVYSVVSFDADGPGPDLPKLYAIGQFANAGATAVPGRAVWDGVSWQPWATELNPGVGPGDMTVADLDGPGPERESIVITGISGTVGSPTPVTNLAAWNGSSWRSFPDSVSGSPGETSQMLAVYDPDGSGPQLPRIFQGYGFLARTFEYDLTTARYLTTPANLGPHRRVKGMYVYDSDGAGPAQPLLYIASDEARSTSGQNDVNMVAWNGSDYVLLPPNGPCGLETSRTDSPMAVWDRDGSGPLNPILVIAMEGCAVSTWDGTAWGRLEDINGTPFGAPNGVTMWDPDGPGPITPRLVMSTGFENGLMYQFDGVNYTSMGSVPGEVLDLGTWDSDNSGVRKLVVVAGTTAHVWNGASWTPIPNSPETQGVYDMGVWDRDGTGPQPEVLAFHGNSAGLMIWNGTTWENPMLPGGESSYGSQLVGGVDLDGPGGPLPNALLMVNAQVGANGGGIYLYTGGGDSISIPPDLGGITCAAVYDPDGAGPVPNQLCIGGNFASQGQRVSAYFARWDKAVDLWASPAGGAFNDPSRWECGSAPRPVNSVVFDGEASGYTPGAYTVTLPAGGGGVQAERVRVRTDAVTLNLSGRTFQTTEQGTFVDPALVVGEIANTPASVTITNSGAPADVEVGTLSIGQTRGTAPAAQGLSVQSANARLLVSGDSLIGHRAVSSSLSLTNGADAVLSGGVSIGDQPQSAGTLSVAGVGATLLHSAAGESLAVGLRGAGTLSIGGLAGGEAGALAGSIGRMDVLSIGSLSGGIGLASVAGAGTAWSVDSNTFAVGYGGQGTLTVQQGGLLATDTTELLAIAAYPGSMGYVSLRDAGTLWQESSAVLTIGNRGTLSVGSGATYRGPGVTINTGGRLTGSGRVEAPLVTRGVGPNNALVNNYGVIDPETDSGTGVAALTIDGDLVQFSAGTGVQTAYATGFEAPEFAVGGLNGQGGWSGDGTVQSGVVRTGAQALRLDASGPASHQAVRSFNFPIAGQRVRMSGDLRRSGTQEQQAGLSLFGDTGFIAQVTYIGGQSYILGNTNSATPAQAFGDNAWHRVEVILDAESQTMSATIDGVSLGTLAINTVPFPTALTSVGLYSFGASGGTQDIYLDNLDVKTVPPPGAEVRDSGVTAIDIIGPAANEQDRLVVNGRATIGGGFVVRLGNGYTPTPGSISNLTLMTAASVAPGANRYDVAYFPGLPAQPDGSVPYFKLDYNQAERAFSVGVSLGTLAPPNFGGPSTFSVAGGPTSAATADLNGDGFLDLAVTVPDPVNPTTANGLAVVLLNAGVTGNTWNGFGTQVSVTVGRNPNGIAIGRFRGPAQPLDVAVANTADGSVMRLGSSGGVNPSFAVSSTLTNVGVNPVSLAVSDLNADGTVDLAVANSGIVGFDAGNARILTNNGSGTFSNGTVLATGFNPVSIAAARVNADAFDDLITANSQSASISVFLRDPTAVTTVAGGTFLPPRQLPTSPQPTEIVPGGLGNPKDLDNDVAVVCQPPGSPGTVDVFANAGDGSGTLAPSVPLEIGEGVSSLALLDMDNDDDTDIAVLAAGTGPNAGSRVVRVLRNDTANAGTGQLTFALQAGEIVANSPTLIRAGDVNNDGQRDLITVNSTTGTFAARPGEPLPDGTIVAVAGSNETAADGSGPVRGGGDRTVSPIAVIRTAAPPPLCPGDLNGDSVVNTADLVVFLGRFGQSVPAYTLGDLNGNGVVNTADLVIFLGRFGQACP